MHLLIDTNRYSDLDAGDVETIERLSAASQVWMPLIALGELLAGFLLGARRAENERNLQSFLSKPNVNILVLDEETAQYYAEIVAVLRRNGTPIPTNDIWIAAQAIQHNLTLDSRDEHFRLVPGLKLA